MFCDGNKQLALLLKNWDATPHTRSMTNTPLYQAYKTSRYDNADRHQLCKSQGAQAPKYYGPGVHPATSYPYSVTQINS